MSGLLRSESSDTLSSTFEDQFDLGLEEELYQADLFGLVLTVTYELWTSFMQKTKRQDAPQSTISPWVRGLPSCLGLSAPILLDSTLSSHECVCLRINKHVLRPYKLPLDSIPSCGIMSLYLSSSST